MKIVPKYTKLPQIIAKLLHYVPWSWPSPPFERRLPCVLKRPFNFTTVLYNVSFDFEAWPWPSRPKATSPKFSKMVLMIRNRIGGDFCEDAFGRDGHGHVSKSKETL
jgi:hypothetical protein